MLLSPRAVRSRSALSTTLWNAHNGFESRPTVLMWLTGRRLLGVADRLPQFVKLAADDRAACTSYSFSLPPRIAVSVVRRMGLPTLAYLRCLTLVHTRLQLCPIADSSCSGSWAWPSSSSRWGLRFLAHRMVACGGRFSAWALASGRPPRAFSPSSRGCSGWIADRDRGGGAIAMSSTEILLHAD